MESPFYSSNSSSFVLYSEPFLNSYFKSYQNIVTLNCMPAGPLAKMVSIVSAPKLSIFKEISPFSTNVYNCTYALLRYPSGSSIKHADYFMTADDIPAILSYLAANGYTIDTDMTKIIQKSRISINGGGNTSNNRKMICMARYSL